MLHVSWNVRLKTAGDPLRAATVGLLAALAVIVPLGVVVWWAGGAEPLAPEGVALGLVSGVVETAYFIFLAAAYRRGDLSVVYPVARGTAPLLAVVIGVTLLGEKLGVTGSIGVLCLLAGFVILQRPWRAIALARRGNSAGRPERTDSAIVFALACGVAIATYSAIDTVGSRLIDPVPYAAILWASMSVLLVVWVTSRRAAGSSAAAGGVTPRRGRRPPHAGGVSLHPRRVERRAAFGRRSVARVGDGPRRRLGVGPARRGRRPHEAVRRSARRSSSSAARCSWRSAARPSRER